MFSTIRSLNVCNKIRCAGEVQQLRGNKQDLKGVNNGLWKNWIDLGCISVGLFSKLVINTKSSPDQAEHFDTWMVQIEVQVV